MAFDSNQLLGKWRFRSSESFYGATASVWVSESLDNWFSVGNSAELLNNFHRLQVLSYTRYIEEEHKEEPSGYIKFDDDLAVEYGGEWQTHKYNDKPELRTISIYKVPQRFSEITGYGKNGINNVAEFYEWLRYAADKISEDPNTAHKLRTPTITINGSIVSWKKVDFAGSYKISYTSVNDITDTGSWITTETTTDILEHLDRAGTYSFNVQALMYETSSIYDFENSDVTEDFEYKVFPKLQTPNIELDETILSWQEVPNASYYTVFFGNLVEPLCSITGLSIDLANKLFEVNKEIPIKVRAYGDATLYRPSEYSNKLNYINNLTFRDEMLLGEWQLNSEVKLMNSISNVFEAKLYDEEGYYYHWFALADYSKRYDNFSYINGVNTQALIYSQLEKGSNYAGEPYLGNAYIGDAYDYAYIDGKYPEGFDKIVIYKVPNEFYSLGTIETFYNLLSRNYTKISNNYEAIIKLETPTLTITSSVLIWNAIENADMYYVERLDSEGTSLGGWYVYTNNCDILEYVNAEGDFSYRVKAIGGDAYDNSSYSNTVSYGVEVDASKLQAPVIYRNGSIVFWGAVPNVDHYVMYFNGGSSSVRIDGEQTTYDLSILFTELGETVAVALRAFPSGDSDYKESSQSNTLMYQVGGADDYDASYINVAITSTKGVKLATQGKYCPANIKVSLDSASLENLKPSNIKKGVVILGITGTKE